MVNGINNIGGLGPVNPGQASSPGAATGGSFADMLKKNIDEVSRLQQDASSAVDALTTGKSDNVSGVMTAVEKSDLAFKTLLSIRAKLMDAYDEIKSIQV
ncbi:MAG TPA: flagellar hook-basal body complex protein FliE [Tepidisphaeraceae bacterium]|nr:flagellar hook-basal body complex protein FliE [Tepidisphaeraceae bacterium]